MRAASLLLPATWPPGLAACHGVYGYAALDSLDRNQVRILYQAQVGSQSAN